jgi:hypothetical protein
MVFYVLLIILMWCASNYIGSSILACFVHFNFQKGGVLFMSHKHNIMDGKHIHIVLVI